MGLLLCRLKRSELSSSTGVTSLILRLSFPSPCSAALSPPSPGVMALAAIATATGTSPAASDFPAKEEISVERVGQKEKFRENEESFSKRSVGGGAGPTDGGAVSHGLFQLGDQRGRGPGGRTNQILFSWKREVEGEVCSRRAATMFTGLTVGGGSNGVSPPELSLRVLSFPPPSSGPAPSP